MACGTRTHRKEGSIPNHWTDPKSRATLRFCNLHHRSIRVQNWEIYFLHPPRGLGLGGSLNSLVGLLQPVASSQIATEDPMEHGRRTIVFSGGIPGCPQSELELIFPIIFLCQSISPGITVTNAAAQLCRHIHDQQKPKRAKGQGRKISLEGLSQMSQLLTLEPSLTQKDAPADLVALRVAKYGFQNCR